MPKLIIILNVDIFLSIRNTVYYILQIKCTYYYSHFKFKHSISIDIENHNIETSVNVSKL